MTSNYFATGGNSLLAIGVALACCGCADNDEPERRSHANEGTVCLSSDVSGVLHAQVVAPVCLSSSCDRLVGSRCRLRISGDRLEIESSFTIEATGARDCTDDCGYATAECSSEAALAGEFTVVHGAESESVSLPQSELVLFAATAGPNDCDFWFSRQPALRSPFGNATQTPHRAKSARASHGGAQKHPGRGVGWSARSLAPSFP